MYTCKSNLIPMLYSRKKIIIIIKENIFEEIMSENFPNLKETDIKIQEAQRAPNKFNSNRPTARYIIIKMAKVKERILKAAREKQSSDSTTSLGTSICQGSSPRNAKKTKTNKQTKKKKKKLLPKWL